MAGTGPEATSQAATYRPVGDEHGFTGATSTVQRYVARLRTRKQEVFMPLAVRPGQEAQVDWHSGWIVDNGVPRKVQFFCMRLYYSKTSFVWAYEHAELTPFLDGHMRALAYCRLAYDNLKSAVVRVGKGRERVLNEQFKRLRSPLPV